MPRILVSVPSSSPPQRVSVAPFAMNAHFVQQRALRGERVLFVPVRAVDPHVGADVRRWKSASVLT